MLVGRLFGVPYCVAESHVQASRLLQEYLPGIEQRSVTTEVACWQISGRGSNTWVVTTEAGHVTCYSTLPGAVRALVSGIEVYAASKTTRYSVIHAAVALLEGQACVLPGRSYAGRCTRVAALV